MGFGRFFSREEEIIPEIEKEEYMEVGVMDSGGERPAGKIGIKIERLNEFSDTEKILRAVRMGSVIFLRIKGLKDKDMGELKRAVEKLKKTVLANNGDIAGVEQDWLVITPQYAAIHRE
jgi:SepF-like predicted cell division protein (DUF552 family)